MFLYEVVVNTTFMLLMKQKLFFILIHMHQATKVLVQLLKFPTLYEK